MSLRPLCRMKRKGWVYFGGLQQSRCMLSAVDFTTWKPQGMFGFFGWHLTQESITNKDFIVRPLKSMKKSTFTVWTLDKCRLHFICTQLTNIPPVQGYGLSRSHADHTFNKLHTWVSKVLESFSFCLELTPEQYHGEMSHTCGSVYDRRPNCSLLYQNCHLSGISKWEGLADTHTAFLWRWNEWRWVIECLACGKQTHRTSSFGLVSKWHLSWAKNDTFVFQVTEYHCWSYCKIGLQGLSTSKNIHVHSCTHMSWRQVLPKVVGDNPNRV